MILSPSLTHIQKFSVGNLKKENPIRGRDVSLNHIDAVRKAANELNDRLSDLMDLAQIPDNSETELRVEAALANVYDAIEEIPRKARNASAIKETGPLIYPNPNAPMGNWKTSTGKSAAALFPGRRASVLKATVPPPRRVMTASQYQKALEIAQSTNSNRNSLGDGGISIIPAQFSH